MMKINCQEKFVVLDKMDAVAQAGHMTNEYSKYKAIHVFYTRPGILAKIINACCMLLLSALALCCLLLQHRNTNMLLLTAETVFAQVMKKISHSPIFWTLVPLPSCLSDKILSLRKHFFTILQ